MNKPKVSVIVPIYNVEKYLDRCMNSLINQTLKDIEIILVDDGSPDNCPKMCDEYAKKDSRIKVIHKQNAGLGYARNSGLDIATGEYVAFVDSDDYVEKDAYERMYDAAKRYNVDAVFSGFKTEMAPDVWEEEETRMSEAVLDKSKTYEFVLGMVANPPGMKDERSRSMSVWHSLYKKKIIDKYNLRFVSERDYVCEDVPFQIDFLTRCNNMAVLPFVCYYYCLNGTSLTATFKKEKFDRYVNLYELLTKKIEGGNDAMLRVNRFFIGYARVQMTQLMTSDAKDKLEILMTMVEHPVWNKIKSAYRVKYLPLYSGIMYWLICHRFVRLLYLYIILFVIGKKIMHKRV